MHNRDKDKLVTIERYENSFDAEVARLALDNEGIPCYLAGMNLMVNMPYPNVIAVELQVFQSDAERAKAILDRTVSDGDHADEPFEGGQ